VRKVADDFSLQAGVPLILARRTPNGLKLTQERFVADGSADAAGRWRTPVTVEDAGGALLWRGIVAAGQPVTIALAPGAVPVVNAGQTGYFRTLYDGGLATELASRFASLDPADQLGLLHDSLALAEAGRVPFAQFLELTRRTPADAPAVVSSTIADHLTAVDYYYQDLPGREAFRAFARARLNPVLARLGWEPRVGEPENEALLRTAVLGTLGALDDRPVIEEARRRFAAYHADPDNLTGAMRQTVLGIAAANAGPEAWDQIHALARAATDPTDKARLYALLGASHDPALADKALALALSDELPSTSRPRMVESVSEVFPDRAFDFALAHREALEAMVEKDARYSFFSRLASGARDLATADKLLAYAKAHVPETGRADVMRALSSIRYRAKVIATRVPDIDRWIAARDH
jgi:aminopeptidase N